MTGGQPRQILAPCHEITPEPVALGRAEPAQRRPVPALMIADIALICDSPIVLIDEIENAGIDKERALACFKERQAGAGCHPRSHTALMARRRIVLAGGAVTAVVAHRRRGCPMKRWAGLIEEQRRYQTQLGKRAYLA